MKGKYSQEVASDTSTYAACSDLGRRPPRVFFEVGTDGGTMRADPPGAAIRCEWRERGCFVAIRSASGEHIAEVIVLCQFGADVTQETIAISSALYWSWWRAQDMCGTTHDDPEYEARELAKAKVWASAPETGSSISRPA